MVGFLRPTSRTVHHHQEEDHNNYNINCVSLTVWRKSLVFSCQGFTVIGSGGSLVYRVDIYSGGRPNQITLMDGLGHPIFTICRRQRLRITESYWLVYEGDVGSTINSSRRPIFCVRKSKSIIKTKPSVLAYVYGGMSKKGHLYMIEGSYSHRSCKILDGSRRVVSEIKRKEASTGGVSFGLEVFNLIVNLGFDPRLAMLIVLLLDQMFS